MMPDLQAIYDEAFYAEWGSGNERYVRTAALIVDALMAEFSPKRVVDIGCGCGVYADLLTKKGVEVVAIDGVIPPAAHAFPVPIQVRDVTVPFENVWGKFDFALCLEVAEHIPEALNEAFLDNLVKFSDVLVLSAAPPNQGGHHHVNEQPKRYWVSRLAQRGYAYDRPRTGRLVAGVQAEKPSYMWMIHQVSVYEKATDPEILKRMLPFNVSLR